ncbi:Flp family type IVb pilin [Arthrobacter sp.]|uniref:Flp family type IVb pilin n=1 Tax=Arthrobacter sp. TaxID=1667 RepID=UPI002810B8DA|nr:Flp family type IVb pilin [Arthrobacter sp.]
MTSLMVSMMAFVAGVKDRLSSEKGATATEYSLLIAFVAFAIMAGAIVFGEALSTWFSDLGDEIGTWAVEPAAPAA